MSRDYIPNPSMLGPRSTSAMGMFQQLASQAIAHQMALRQLGSLTGLADGCKLLVDGVGGQMPRFQVHAIAHDDDTLGGQPRLGAVPRDKLIDGVLVNAARQDLASQG